ncbi:MAG TPA: septal ring lytic transglycosylase RlpA family protein [Solirubrobacterales bacterium]|nr:septal ring lytic transglycosylase RlpA family protein [Solirubrobacterales bacterium]
MPEPRNPHPALRLRAFAVLLVLATFVAGTGSAQAGTGGASMAHGGASPVGEDIAFGPFRTAGASWYGPGLWGNSTACGQTLRPRTLGVAHRSLPCGTAVKFVYRGRALVTQVIDRGPFTKGRAWDLTAAASEALGFEGVGMVRYAVAVEYARPGLRR